MEGLVLRLAVQATTGLGRLEIGGIVRLLFDGSGLGQQSWSPGPCKEESTYSRMGQNVEGGLALLLLGLRALARSL